MSNILLNTARYARHALLTGIRAIGGFSWLAQTQWRRQRLLILCYHGVSLQDEHEWDPELFVTPAFLRRRFEILNNMDYTILPLGEAVRALQTGSLPHRSVVLTFDDGFYNFYSAAVPLLEEFGYSATNYVSSYHCINQRPLLRLTLRYLLWRARQQVVPAGMFPGLDTAIELSTSDQRNYLADRLLKQAEKLAHDRMAQLAWLGSVATSLGINWQEIVDSRLFHLMTTDELAEVARRGFDIQLHTHRHRTPRDKSTFMAEIRENRRILETTTGHPATHFCYPCGDVDPMFLPWLRELNVETATTGVIGLAKAEHDPLLLPRFVDTMAQSETQFESWLSGAGLLVRRRGG